MDDDHGRSSEHPYVAHYSWPPEPQTPPDQRRLAAEERDLARASYVARWRGLRYALGIVLACASILGGALAVMSVLAAWSARGTGTTSLVLSLSPGGGQRSLTLTSAQMTTVAVAMVFLETLTVCAAGLLFAKGMHPRLWGAVAMAALIWSGAAVWASVTSRHDLLSLYTPVVWGCPVIVIAGIVQLLRAHRMRVRWG